MGILPPKATAYSCINQISRLENNRVRCALPHTPFCRIFLQLILRQQKTHSAYQLGVAETHMTHASLIVLMFLRTDLAYSQKLYLGVSPEQTFKSRLQSQFAVTRC